MQTDKYLDKIDVNTCISLYEYGFIRDPVTGKTIVCLNPSSEEHTKKNPPEIIARIITFENVKYALEHAPDEYFSFIGCTDRVEYIKCLYNDQLTSDIMSLTQYNDPFMFQPDRRKHFNGMAV